MKRTSLIGILLMTLLSLSAGARAEGGCPAGMQPYQPSPNRYSCMPLPAGGGSSRGPAFNSGTSVSTPNSHWEDRWGAIATDEPRGVVGVATGITIKQVAQQAALKDCKAKGGIQCKVDYSYKNGCAALTSSNTNYNVLSSDTQEMAIAEGIQLCVKEGLQNCQTYYSACSPAVLMRD